VGAFDHPSTGFMVGMAPLLLGLLTAGLDVELIVRAFSI
jgi:hypothetical protein